MYFAGLYYRISAFFERRSMLTNRHCELFDRPFFQFAQLKKYQPETIPQLKADYKAAWQDWRQTVEAAAALLGAPLAPPHIERWCNGWQVRAHFFAFFKYAQYCDSAVILSVLLNRRRLGVHLDWHAHKAAQSAIPLVQYRRWTDYPDMQRYADFDVWHDSEGEYADYRRAGSLKETDWQPENDADFLCIGRHIEKNGLRNHPDSAAWIADTVRSLLPLYETVFA